MGERKTYFVTVILPIPIHKEFTYRVPFELNEKIILFGRVIVPFGKSKLHTAIVTSVTEVAPTEYQAKYVEYVLDENPIITIEQNEFWKWISSYYMAPIGDVMSAALPANLKLASESKIIIHPDFDGTIDHLDDREMTIFEILETREILDLKEISDILKIKVVQPIIKRMIERRIVLSVEELNEKFNPKTAVFVELGSAIKNEEILQDEIQRLEHKKSAHKQLENLLIILREGEYNNGVLTPIEKKKLLEAGCNNSSLLTLEKQRIIELKRKEISRLADHSDELSGFKDLSENQKKVLDELQVQFEQHRTCLLHGVTGSGKTEIYVQLINDQLKLGKQVLFLLPEIALTTQLIQRLSAYFGNQIGVYHSRFNQNERVEIWNNVLSNNPNKFRIILGARSSVFLPFRDLGLIIVDEEHETSFKQYDPSPRYNARDAAIVLGHFHHSKILLGSATPSMETFYNAQHGKYGYIELKERFGGIKLPEVLVADVKKERRQKAMNANFTSFLIDNIREALNKKEQIILFQNRRGYTPMWSCEICNWTPKCKNCDVSLTYHKQTNTLKCHYCSYTMAPIGTCSCCGSNRLKMVGYGTERIEDDLSLIFPNNTFKRMDLDTTRSKYAYETILTDFAERKIDILIGTQMVTKGLDFDNVSLVGVLDADMLMNRADFRAFERSYQLMSQVAGRSGRKGSRGKVIIQTGDPDNWLIQRVIDHDYIGFYNHELIERKNFFYPPFYKMIEFTLKHKDDILLDKASIEFAESLRNIFKERVIGPEYPVVRRIQNLYLKQIKLKVEKESPDKKIKERIQQLIDAFYSVPLNKSIRIIVDVDPA